MLIRAIPGDPAQVILGQQATKEAVEALRTILELDNPWYTQYFSYLGGILQGDLGVSLRTKVPVSTEIFPYLAATAELAIFAMIIAVITGVNAGIISAWFQNSWFDYTDCFNRRFCSSIPVRFNGAMDIQ